MVRKSILNDKTMVPVGLAVVVIGAASGWVTKTTFQLSDHSERLERIESNSEQIKTKVTTIETMIRGSRGSKPEEPPNLRNSASGIEGEDLPSLSRRLHELRTGDAPDKGTGLNGGPETYLDEGA